MRGPKVDFCDDSGEHPLKRYATMVGTGIRVREPQWLGGVRVGTQAGRMLVGRMLRMLTSPGHPPLPSTLVATFCYPSPSRVVYCHILGGVSLGHRCVFRLLVGWLIRRTAAMLKFQWLTAALMAYPSTSPPPTHT